MSRRVMLLFAAALVLVPVQTGVRQAVGEPFPSLFMPSFGAVPDDGRTYEVLRPDLEVRDAAGRRTAVPARDLAADANVLPTEVLRLLAHDGLRADGTAADGPALIDDPEVRAWLRQRIAARFPGRRIERAAIAWRQLRIDRKSREIVSGRTVKRVQVLPR